MRNSRAIGPLVVLVLGVLLVGAGVTTSVATPRTFGWFAYQPLPADQALPASLFRGHLWGLTMAVLGALLLSGLLGYRIGQRQALPEE